MSRDRLVLPIVLGALSILFTVAVIVGWNVVFTHYYTLSKQVDGDKLGTGFWTVLAVGNVFLVVVLSVLITFLVSNIRKELLVARQNTFIDSVTHELKSPIASLKLALETLVVREVPPDIQKRFLAMMRGDVERLRRFVEGILEAGRLEHDRREMLWEPVDPAALVDHAIERVCSQHLIDRNKLRVENRLPEPCALVADPVALEMVLINLLDNAVKYSFGEVDVRVEIKRLGDQLVVRVSDRGVGIPRSKLKKIFRRFYRLKLPKSHRVPGTGLGLYLAASLAERLGGRLTADSPGVGCGATFQLTLPIQADAL